MKVVRHLAGTVVKSVLIARVSAGVTLLVFLLGSGILQAQSGQPLWTNVYNGPGNFTDAAVGIVEDGQGKVFVTGNSFASDTSYDYATIAYSSAGLPLWTNRYNGPASGQDFPSGIAVDTNGNVYVTGGSPGSNGDFATVAYSNAGLPLWTNRYNGPNNGADNGVAMAVDKNNNVFVAGTSYDGAAPSGPAHWATIKYSSAGVPLWTNRFVGTANSYDAVSAIVTDTNGDAIVTGITTANDDSADYTTIKYSSAGIALWTNYYAGPNQANDNPDSLGVDASGNVYVTGNGYKAGSTSLRDDITIAYTGAGVPLWTNRFTGRAGTSDNSAKIKVAPSGNVYVVGYSSLANYDWLVLAYSSTGSPRWTNYFNGSGNSTDAAQALALDTNENVYVTGYTTGSDGTRNYTTIMYSPLGLPIWTNSFVGPGNGTDEAHGIAVDPDGNVYVTGFARGSTSRDDFTTIKYEGSSTILPILYFRTVGNQIVLSWTDGSLGLQSAPTVDSTFTNIAGAMSPYTNAMSGGQKYFRLKTTP